MKKSEACLARVPSFAVASAGERACFWGRTRYVFFRRVCSPIVLSFSSEPQINRGLHD